MKIPLAWLNLIHGKVRSVVAVTGVAFAVVLIFMQLGFLGAVESTATVVYDALDFDICLRSKKYLHLADPRAFSIRRLYQAAAVPGVRDVHPFYSGMNQWRNPQSGARHGILVMGIKAGAPVFLSPEISEQSRKLVAPEFVLIDRTTRAEFGPRNERRFGPEDVGVVTEIGDKRVTIVGHFELGTGLSANGVALLSDRGFMRVSAHRRLEGISLGLIRLEPDRRGDADLIAARIREIVPDDVEVLTRKMVIERELDRWVHNTSFGLIFQLGVVVALIVGVAIVYQVLAADVASHLPEYATLRAMGYRHGYLVKVILQQAMLVAVLGYVPGLALSALLYRITSALASIPIRMEGPNIVLVFVLALTMCSLSGLGALRKVRQADPAELF